MNKCKPNLNRHSYKPLVSIVPQSSLINALQLGSVCDSDFVAPWWAQNRHIQTIFPRFLQKRAALTYRSEDFPLPDGDQIKLVWIGDADKAKALVVMFHGLEGSIESHYCHDTAASLLQLGYAVVVMHFRGCGGKPNLLARAYHSGETEDAWYLLCWLKQRYPAQNILTMGFSLGANMLLKLLGERPEQNIIQGAVAVSAPLLLNECADSINRGFARVYQAYLLKSMLKTLHHKMQRLDYNGLLNITVDELSNITNFRDFDQHITAPLHGFEGADDYYQQSSALPFLARITIPTLVLHAKDDPFMNHHVIPSVEHLSEFVRVELSERGGHCGFVQGTPWCPQIWFQQRCANFFQTLLTENEKVKSPL